MMKTTKDSELLATLMQNGYDYKFIASPGMKGNEELEAQFVQMTSRLLKSLNQIATTYEDFSENDKQYAFQRFCMTTGMGAAWWWENRRDEVNNLGLYEAMANPRTEDEMDEYIEDTIGIWYSKDSLQHRLYRRHFRDCFRIIEQFYDLNKTDDEFTAGLVMMTYGMYCGYTRHLRQHVVSSYKGEMQWHWEVWMALYGMGEDGRLDEYKEWSWKAITDGKSGMGNDVIIKDKDSEYGWLDKFYHSSVYHEVAGIRSISFNDNGICKIVASSPVFESGRTYILELDQVEVWDNGVEATLTAHFANDPGLQITFFDTHYLENKDLYVRGMMYVFDLYGVAYHAQIVPEKERSFVFEGDAAVNFNQKIGKETTYDDQGTPAPVIFHTDQLHCLMQTNDKIPEDATFRAPIKNYCKTVDFLGKPVYAIEVGLPFRNEDGENEHNFTLYVSSESSEEFVNPPKIGTPINAVVRLQGKMLRVAAIDERPSRILHSFEALDDDGNRSVFEYLCPEDEYGQEMDDDEKHQFACEILAQQFANIPSFSFNKNASEPTDPVFYASRKRDIWVRADMDYNAGTAFENEDVTSGMLRHIALGRFPVMAYVTIYDLDGKRCRWIKGEAYTATIHYGSMTPGQKMHIMGNYEHNELVEILYDSYKKLDTRYLAFFLHKDIDIRSPAVPDPIITSAEYLYRTEIVNENNRKHKQGSVKPELLKDENDEAYIKMVYPIGNIDIVKVETSNGLITSINITNIEK